MAKLIGTAGHVDHGKTTLIQALTGIDADRLPEEKRRGMTIDIGFAYIELSGHGRVSIVDVPGHERFLTNMLVGALGIDVALLCVAADESVKPQTREHLQILELLPVDRLIVALTRADLADEDTRLLARMEVEELLKDSRFCDTSILEVSALTGEGLDALRGELSRALDDPAVREGGPWYLPIDRVFSSKGHGCVVTGTLSRGQVKVGDTAFLEPGHKEVRVRAIQSHAAALESADQGLRTALNLSGIRLEEVRRGQALGARGALFATRALDANVKWLEPVKHGTRVRVSLGSEEAIGKAFLSDGDPSLVQLRLEGEVACALNQPLIVRRYSPPDLLAGGRVVVPLATVRRRSEAPVVIIEGTGRDGILKLLGDNPKGITTEEICRRLGKTAQTLGDEFEKLLAEDKIRGFAGLWYSREGFDQATEQFMSALLQIHEREPTQAFQPRERAVEASRLQWAGKQLDRIVSTLQQEGKIEVQGTGVKAATFHIQLSGRQREFLDRIMGELAKEPVNSPGAHDIARSVGAPPQAVEQIMHIGVQSGELVSLRDGIFYTQPQWKALQRRIRDVVGAEPFTAAQIRDKLGTTRKYAIPILEQLDLLRLTTRVGDQRMINEKAWHLED